MGPVRAATRRSNRARPSRPCARPAAAGEPCRCAALRPTPAESPVSRREGTRLCLSSWLPRLSASIRTLSLIAPARVPPRPSQPVVARSRGSTSMRAGPAIPRRHRRIIVRSNRSGKRAPSPGGGDPDTGPAIHSPSSLDQKPSLHPAPQRLRQTRRLRADPPIDQFAARGDHTNLTCHQWAPMPRWLTALGP